jgi:hypothetical protein
MKLKKQYENTKVIRNGITFDSEINNSGEYEYFFKNGFADLFEIDTEEVEKPKTLKYKGIKQNGKNK